MAEITKQINWAEKALGLVLQGSAVLIFNNYLRLWRLLKYRALGLKDRRTIYGKLGNRLITGYADDRNQPTCIIGQPGFGKSAEAVNLAIQDIEQDEAGVFIDPHGNPHETDEKKKGAVVKIFERVKDIGRVVFLSVNQIYKVIGYNPLFLITSIDTLDQAKDDLMDSLFYDSLESGYQVAIRAKLILESVLYFHNAYCDWLIQVKGKTNQQIKTILRSHQLTINDLANLNNHQGLIDLLIEILSFKASKFYRPDLVLQWQDIKDKKALDAGMLGAVGRLEKIVSTTKAKYFFESHGFNLIEERKRGKFILCDMSGLDNFTKAIISKLIFVKIHTLHISGILKTPTRAFFDEAAKLAMTKLADMISEGRKFFLDLTLIIQYQKQFENSKDALAVREACVNKIYFRSYAPEYNAALEKIANLRKREFIFINSRGVYEGVKTLDMPPILRQIKLTERGVDREELRTRIIAKQIDIYSYFINI